MEFNPGRRDFMRTCCAVGTAAALGPRLAFADAASTDGILIVLFLRGGCDALNLFPPLSGADRSEYEIARPGLQVPLTGSGAALDLNGQFGVHPAGAELKALYDGNLLAIVRATGNTETASRSHFDAMRYLESGTPYTTGTGTGWLTRYFQSLTGLPPSIVIPSVAAASYTPQSFASDPYVLTMNDPGAFSIGSNAHWSWNERLAEQIPMLYTGASTLETAGAQAITAAQIIAAEDFSSYVPSGGATYPAHYLGDQFRMLAQIIKLDVGLRVGALDFGGWDTHVDQGDDGAGYFAAELVAPLAQSLYAFMADLSASGDLGQRTTVVVQTEFSRRLRQNAGGGTDHGSATDTLIIGESVNGGAFYGDWPGLGSNELFEGQDILVTTDYRRVLSEVLIRRLENPYLGTIFPGYSGYQPLGIVQGADLTPVYETGEEEADSGPSWASGWRAALLETLSEP